MEDEEEKPRPPARRLRAIIMEAPSVVTMSEKDVMAYATGKKEDGSAAEKVELGVQDFFAEKAMSKEEVQAFFRGTPIPERSATETTETKPKAPIPRPAPPPPPTKSEPTTGHTTAEERIKAAFSMPEPRPEKAKPLTAEERIKAAFSMPEPRPEKAKPPVAKTPFIEAEPIKPKVVEPPRVVEQVKVEPPRIIEQVQVEPEPLQPKKRGRKPKPLPPVGAMPNLNLSLGLGQWQPHTDSSQQIAVGRWSPRLNPMQHDPVGVGLWMPRIDLTGLPGEWVPGGKAITSEIGDWAPLTIPTEQINTWENVGSGTHNPYAR